MKKAKGIYLRNHFSRGYKGIFLSLSGAPLELFPKGWQGKGKEKTTVRLPGSHQQQVFIFILLYSPSPTLSWKGP